MRITDWSLDIETMGTGQRAAVCQIGLVGFDRNTGELGEQICIDVNVQSCIKLGGEIHANTVHWWATQKQGFHYANKDDIFPIENALNILSKVITEYTPIPIWAKGPMFDLSVIEFYCNRLDIQVPWKYNMPRDLRTLQDAYEFTGLPPLPRKEITHNALQDAIGQADMICRLLKR